MRALVTGATGLVGSHVAERLAADGWAVRALARDPQAAAWLRTLGAEPVAGDVLDAASFARAAAGCDLVVHAAAAISPRGGGWEGYRRPNVDGTANAVEAARAAGARLVHVSSVAVYGPGTRAAAPVGEDAPLSPLDDGAWYARSKREAERVALGAHRTGRAWVTALRPCVVYGPRDRQFVPRAARLLRTGLAPRVGSGATTLALVHAASVADAAVRAALADAAGGRAYNVANDFALSVRRFAELAGEGLGRRVRLVPVPRAAAGMALGLAQLAARVLVGPGAAALGGGTLDFVSRDNPFTSDRARLELGWSPPVPPDIGVPAAFRWWREARA